MKRWSGGILILSLSAILLLRYSLLPATVPRRPSTVYSSSHLSSVSDPNPLPNLIWPHLRPLLSRSDSLPSTSSAAREAASAWTDLAAELPLKLSSLSNVSTSCPFSAVAFVSGNITSLSIPCGFVEDSAITIVAIPSGPFYLDLVGSGTPPIILLRYNVSLSGGDGSTIVHSSWTPETGWVEWQRCPEPDGNLKSVANGRKTMSLSSINFPFTEGLPFTSTLWAGHEGFHMTVNGRHETSLMYKERLEPWSVIGVRVQGDLEVLSCFANGLPVAEDLELVRDVDKLRAPKLAKHRLFMLIGVISSSNNFARRQALRRSWMQYGSGSIWGGCCSISCRTSQE
ncbi:hypothetical protein HPP92_009835 [Vanilla planifolia]|uniref:Galectin n=1 Tax=Vanilla planifolia TaxID=51239 RepID=A0A835RGJ0_VANPL|nr:hypothetical protein HPP92_009835 [Vanilla planifolia]